MEPCDSQQVWDQGQMSTCIIHKLGQQATLAVWEPWLFFFFFFFFAFLKVRVNWYLLQERMWFLQITSWYLFKLQVKYQVKLDLTSAINMVGRSKKNFIRGEYKVAWCRWSTLQDVCIFSKNTCIYQKPYHETRLLQLNIIWSVMSMLRTLFCTVFILN